MIPETDGEQVRVTRHTLAFVMTLTTSESRNKVSRRFTFASGCGQTSNPLFIQKNLYDENCCCFGVGTTKACGAETVRRLIDDFDSEPAR